MPFVFGIAAVLLIVAGVRGQTTQLFTLVKSDFTGQPNYFEWMIAIFLVGAIGYVKELQTISRMFMVLLILGLLWEHKGVFAQFTTQETQQPKQSSGTNTTLPTLPAINENAPAFNALPETQQEQIIQQQKAVGMA